MELKDATSEIDGNSGGSCDDDNPEKIATTAADSDGDGDADENGFTREYSSLLATISGNGSCGATPEFDRLIARNSTSGISSLDKAIDLNPFVSFGRWNSREEADAALTRRLSRSRTLVAALRKLSLPTWTRTDPVNGANLGLSDDLNIHVLGADLNEGTTELETIGVFDDLLAWLWSHHNRTISSRYKGESQMRSQNNPFNLPTSTPLRRVVTQTEIAGSASSPTFSSSPSLPRATGKRPRVNLFLCGPNVPQGMAGKTFEFAFNDSELPGRRVRKIGTSKAKQKGQMARSLMDDSGSRNNGDSAAAASRLSARLLSVSSAVQSQSVISPVNPPSSFNPPSATSLESSGLSGWQDAMHVVLRYSCDLYHDEILRVGTESAAVIPKADLCVCFNAGVWGYSDWLPTLQLLLQGKGSAVESGRQRDVGCPLVLTSYNAREAEDDLEVLWAINSDIEEARCQQQQQPQQQQQQQQHYHHQWSLETMRNAVVLWGPALNPFRSLERRMCDGLPNELMFENCCWLCLAPPHIGVGLSASARKMRTSPEQEKKPSLVTLAALDPRANERKGKPSASSGHDITDVMCGMCGEDGTISHSSGNRGGFAHEENGEIDSVS